MAFETVIVAPMLAKHLWTSIYSPKGRFPGGLWAKAAAVYEALFYVWLLTLQLGSLVPIVALMAVIHFVGVPLYFLGILSRYSKYGKYYGAFEALELVFLILIVYIII